MTHEFRGFPDDEWPVIVLWRHYGTWTMQEEDLVRGRVMRLINIDRNNRHGHLLVLLRQQAGRRRFLSLFGKRHHTYFATRARTQVRDKAVRGKKVPGRYVDFADLDQRLEKIGARTRVDKDRRAVKAQGAFAEVLAGLPTEGGEQLC